MIKITVKDDQILVVFYLLVKFLEYYANISVNNFCCESVEVSGMKFIKGAN
ncbi:hypothetical protein EDC24_2835 [Aquisalibacillus elongatus]|uniref:Uncharacterized protein n=1 Tax=Aquisalibacillus elongatus TaxID=485577 RepID=A0A3N5AZH0_9BACI|nr:hypothetical protein EDC24_2835 [Aquisalibacillus elongatus]